MTTIGLVGCGRWGRNILRDLLAIGCRIDVVDPDPEARALAVAAGAASAVAALDPTAPTLDGYVVAAITVEHAACVRACLATGRPVFCEKPLTNDLAAAEALASEGADRLFVMDKWRYHPGVERLGTLARDGTLGAPLLLETRRLQWGVPHDDVDTLWILAPHELTIALEILGDLPAVTHASGLVEGDRVLEASVSLGGTVPVRFTVSSLSPTYQRGARLVCETGTAYLDDPMDDFITVQSRVAESEPQRLVVSGGMPLRRELEAFVAHLRGGPPPRSSAEEAVLVVRRVAEIRAALGCPA